MSWSSESIAPDAERVLERAFPEALSLGMDCVGTEAVLLAMVRLGTPELIQALRRVGSSRNKLEVAIRDSAIGRIGVSADAPLPLAARAIRAVEYAEQSARLGQRLKISNQDLLIGLLNEREGIAHAILTDIGVDVPTVLGD